MAAGNFITEFLPTGKQNLAPAFAKKGSITACFLPRKYGGEKCTAIIEGCAHRRLHNAL